MAEQVSSLVNLRVGDQQYLFILVNESDQRTTLAGELRTSHQKFGKNAGLRAKVVTAYSHQTTKVFAEAIAKAWPVPIATKLRAADQPLMIVINKDFAEFDPGRDQWIIVLFSALADGKKRIPHLFDILERRLKGGNDLFEFADEILEGRSNEIPRTCLLTKHHPEQEILPPKRRKRAILDEEFGVKGHIRRLHEQGRIDPSARDWKSKLAKDIEALLADSLCPFKQRSIRDVLAKSGILAKIKEGRIDEI